ncbi:hypothetical protein PGIGA_G00223410, partial [Pangasianodon gigas]|nr:hypothetical protein [Pangasianodon gigas]
TWTFCRCKALQFALHIHCLFYHFSLTPTRCSIQPVKGRNHVRNAKRLMVKMMNGD